MRRGVTLEDIRRRNVPLEGNETTTSVALSKGICREYTLENYDRPRGTQDAEI